tara:strand:- start:136 stop:510 length:375 start_codon:yes stop_codon:yes gene_type:complete
MSNNAPVVYRRANTRVSIISFYPSPEDKRPAAEQVESVAAKLGRGFAGIVFVPGGKATSAFRQKLVELANERGFAVFASEPKCDPTIVGQRVQRASNGIFASSADENAPIVGWANLEGVRLTMY